MDKKDAKNIILNRKEKSHGNNNVGELFDQVVHVSNLFVQLQPCLFRANLAFRTKLRRWWLVGLRSLVDGRCSRRRCHTIPAESRQKVFVGFAGVSARFICYEFAVLVVVKATTKD